MVRKTFKNISDTYIPDRGDIVFMDFDPVRGHEQSGRRPAIILSDFYYNKRSGFVLACPITSKIKNYPFEIPIKTKEVKGVILSDQIKSFFFESRNLEFKERADLNTIEKTTKNIIDLLR